MTLEFSSRLVNAVVPNANLHIGWHWDPAALARWTSMMPLSSRLALELVRSSEFLLQLVRNRAGKSSEKQDRGW